MAAAARSAGDGPPQSRPRCPCQTRDPSGRQTDLGLRAAPSRCGGRGAEGLRCPGSPSSSEPLPPPPSSWVSRYRPCSAKGARGGISRGGISRRGRGHPDLPSSRGRCPAAARRLGFGVDRPWRSRGDPGSCGDPGSRDPERAARPRGGGYATAEGVRGGGCVVPAAKAALGGEVRGPSAAGGTAEALGAT